MSRPMPLSLDEAAAAVERTERGLSLTEQASEWSGSLRLFLEHAWTDGLGIATPFVAGWHLDAICEHLQAVSTGEILRLAICVPPGSTKSTAASVCFPVWEWTRAPKTRFLTFSYSERLATRFSVLSRTLIKSDWFQARWGSKFKLSSDENLKTEYANNWSGRRLAMPTVTGTGEHGDIVVIDDPHDANSILSDAKREACIDWHDGTLVSRFTDSKLSREVIIAQRLHQKDLIGHVLQQEPEAWTVLCLPERYEPKHKHVTPYHVQLASGRVILGDCREVEGELLCPNRIDAEENLKRQRRMSAFRAAGQLQQRPAPREGTILKRQYWKFFPPEWLEDGQRHLLPSFHGLMQSWDTAFKNRTVNDYVCGGLWGLIGADMYLLALRKERLSLSGTKQAIRDMTALQERCWPSPWTPMHIVIERAANGPDIMSELQREIRGITPFGASSEGDKIARAEAAEPTLEGGNVFVPGAQDPNQPSGYDEARTPWFTQELIESCSVFPGGEHDDDVDMFTMAAIWSRGEGRVTTVQLLRSQEPMPAAGSIAGVSR